MTKKKKQNAKKFKTAKIQRCVHNHNNTAFITVVLSNNRFG